MKGIRIKKVLSVFMAVFMLAGIIPDFAYANETGAGTASPYVVSYKRAAGTLNLTEEGSDDWVHITKEETNRKKDAEKLIEVDGSLFATLNDSPVEFSWADGSQTGSAGGQRGGGVFRDYEIKVKPVEYERKLVFVSGSWQAEGELELTDYEGKDQITTFSYSTGNSAEVRIYTVLIDKGHGIRIKNKTSRLFDEVNGNISLSGIAIGRLEEPKAEGTAFHVYSAPNHLNLTEEGGIDWIHPEGEEDTTVRKDIDTPVLQLNKRSAEDMVETFHDAVPSSWTDGTPISQSDRAGSGALYTYKKEDTSIIGQPLTEESGFEIIVPTADYKRVLTFVSGVWNARVKYSVFVDGAEEETASHLQEGGGSGAETRLYELEVKPGQAVKVIGQYAEKFHNHGNVTLSAVMLRFGDSSSHREKCEKLIGDVAKLNDGDVSLFAADQLEKRLDIAKQVLADQESNSFEVYKAYMMLYHAYELVFAQANGIYKYESNPGLTASFGWEGDWNAPIAFIDGSYQLRSYNDTLITFGVADVEEKISWYNAEGYLPCFVSEYSKNGMDYRIENFADLVYIDDNAFEIAYSRMTVTNNTDTDKKLPVVSEVLIPLNDAAKETVTVASGKSVVRDYAVPADKFKQSYAWPSEDKVAAEGGFDKHYNHMKEYWNARLEAIVDITELPDPTLINAYKAGFIYTLIIRDDLPQEDGSILHQLHVGENGYDNMWDHDTIGIVASLLTVGDFKYAKEYLAAMPAQLQYDDAKWKYSWPYALYLQKTGDIDYINESFEQIKYNTHMVEADRINGGTGIMKETFAIDSIGYWTIDNWSALAGLTTYSYLCEQTGNTAELKWAQEQYDSLLKAVNKQLTETMTKYNLDYIPISMVEPNETGERKDPRDANWASMFLFGRWGWDGYLFGAEQEGVMIDKIDDTYTHGFKRRAHITDNPCNFGGYPHGFFSSAYNAGYGSTALRGEAYRDAGIKGYQFMIQEAMSGPFSWWEGVDWQRDESPWDISHASGGGGSCQHMWGQSTATKVLVDSLIAEKSDGTVIIGRGIPQEWISDGNPIELTNYPIAKGRRMGYRLVTSGKTVTITFTGDTPAGDISIELMAFRDSMKSVSAGEIDQEAGIVTVPAGTTRVTVELGETSVDPGQKEKADKTELKKALDAAKAIDQDKYTADSVKKFKAAYEEAKAVYNNDDLTVDDQKSVDDAAENLMKAIKELDPTRGSGGSGGGSGSGSGTGKSKSGKAANTGDHNHIVWWLLLGVCSMGCVIFSRRYKKRKNLW